MKPFKIAEGVYQVGGPDMTAPEDCCFFLVDLGRPVLIDAGAGADPRKLLRNLEELGYSPGDIKLIVLTHCHIDHVGGAAFLVEKYGLPLAIHALDASPIEDGDTRRTAANWYGMDFAPTRVKFHLEGESGDIEGGASPIRWIHTPGHTPGSISLLIDNGMLKVLFGQDIHGPFYASFGSDIDAWSESMRKLLELEADILCEGHFGIIRPASEVRAYIEGYLRDYGKL
ncbi:MAG: MBL fold metallo-hydrolase [Actinobacteria bacterium]|nr:MAG: MBL fold metallo-hydrolase [Actinomycetota bacterium]